MAELAGHSVIIEYSADGTTWTSAEIAGVTSLQVGRERNLIDITHFKDTTGAVKRLAGLKDAKASLSGNLDLADTNQNALRSRYDDGVQFWIGWKWDGSTRLKLPCFVASYSENATPDGAVEFSCELEGHGVIASA